MFENILPHQIILIWIGISGLTGTIVSLMVSEGKNPLYILGNIFFCGFVGALFGGFFVALTDALVWDFWSLLLPVFVGGIVSFLIAIFLRDKIPKPTIDVKPIAMVLAILMIVMLSIVSAYPVVNQPTRVLNVSGVTPAVINIGNVRILRPSGVSYDTIKLADALNTNTITFDISTLTQLMNRPNIIVSIDSYYTSIDFPSRLAENPQEGDYLNFKLTFEVPSTSPTDWREPVWYTLCWGDVNYNGTFDKDVDIVLGGEFYKIPSKIGDIVTSGPCVYDAEGNPMWAMYSFETEEGDTICLPIIFGLYDDDGEYPYNPWKDDSQYTFVNTPEGFKPPYDQGSLQIDASGHINYKEKVYGFAEITKGHSCDVYGKIYCPIGMPEQTSDWYFTVIAYDYAYSKDEAIAVHNMHFQVSDADGGDGGDGGEPPDVDISSTWWVETALFAIVGIACLALVKYGGKYAFK